MSPTIRAARPSDCEELVSLVERYWNFERIEGFDREAIAKLLRGFIAQPERSRCWLAGDPGEVRGYLLAVYVVSLEFGGTVAEIDELYVLEAYRSMGLGERLVQQAMADMKQAGVVHLQLQLGTANASGRAFYERLGFVARTGYELLGKSL
ncbi:MAG TPA: GNAT family N-acetyltransferase [Steroidobacteraceae bacterium]|jgi:ribosomal protein S18 acetylase RimI-like enzyme|nr:GNAT family N-acetyltransferase [Steroidobacteraceae bacterium]